MLLGQPDLHVTMHWVWEAYARLDKSRQFGFNGPQPISLSEIEAYCRLNDIEDRSDLIQYIQLMDSAYIDHAREKAKADEKKRGRTSSRHKGGRI
jgi:hypothetical protein